MAIANRPKPPPVDHQAIQHQGRTPGSRRSTENVYRFLEDGEVVCFCSSEWHNVGATQFYPSGGWQLSFSHLGVWPFKATGKPVTFRVTATGTRLTGKSGLVGYFDAPPDKPTVFEFVRYMEPRTTITMLPYGLGGREHGAQGRWRKMGRTRAGDPVYRRRRAAATRPGRRKVIAASSATCRKRQFRD